MEDGGDFGDCCNGEPLEVVGEEEEVEDDLLWWCCSRWGARGAVAI